MHEKLEVAFGAWEAAGAVGNDGQSTGFCGGTDAIDCTAMEGGVADDAATTDGGAFQFELGFNQEKEQGARSGEWHESR